MYDLIACLRVFSQYTSIKPLGDRVLVKLKPAEEKTEGGILLPTTVQTKPQGGEVVAVGEGRTLGKNKVEIGVPVSRWSLSTDCWCSVSYNAPC